MPWLLPAVPRRLFILVVLGGIATVTGFLPLKMAVPILAAAFIIAASRSGGATDGPELRAAGAKGTTGGLSWRGWIIAALVLSAIGDVFMSNQNSGGEAFLVSGIIIYLGVHLAYIVAAMSRGRFRWGVFTFVAIGIGLVATVLVPQIDSVVVAGAIIVYTVISAVSLAAAMGIEEQMGRILMSLAIGLILVSDIAIGFRLFLDFKPISVIILPTYFASHVLLTWDAIGVRSRRLAG